jgi:hypothetical protein
MTTWRRALPVWLALSLGLLACPASAKELESALHACKVTVPDSWNVRVQDQPYGDWVLATQPGRGNLEILVAPASQFGTAIDADFGDKFEKWVIKPPYVKVRGGSFTHRGMSGYELETKGMDQGENIASITRAFLVGDRTYVLALTFPEGNLTAQQERSAILASFTVNAAAQQRVSAPASVVKKKDDLHELSKKVGGGALLFLIVVWLRSYLKRRRQRQPK